jgi:hypothetical protein
VSATVLYMSISLDGFVAGPMRDRTTASVTAGVRPEDLDALTGNERNEIYGMLRLEITPSGGDYAMRGVFRTPGLLSGP